MAISVVYEYIQKQSPEVLCKKRCTQKFRKIPKKTPVPFLIKLQASGSNHGEKNKKTTYLKNIFDSRPYQFTAFTFLLKPLHKIFFTAFAVNLKQKVKMSWEKIFCVNDSKIIYGKLIDNNISTK